MARKGIDIEDKINEIEMFVDSCKFQPLSSSKIIVPKDDLTSMLDELKLKLPNEIERCKKIIRNREAILAAARSRADSIITESVAEANKMVEQSTIVEQANYRANEILELARSQAEQIVLEANNEASEIRIGAMHYTRDNLSQMQNQLLATLEAEKANYQNLITSLEQNAQIFANNIAEINASIDYLNGVSPSVEDEYDLDDGEENIPEEDFNVYGKTEYSEEEEDDDFDDDVYDDDDDDFLDD